MGLGTVGIEVVEELVGAGRRVVVIDRAEAGRHYAKARALGVPVVVGEATDFAVLDAANLAAATAVAVLTSDDLVNLSAALQVHRLNPGVRIGVRVFNRNLIPRLGAAVANIVGLSTSALTAPLLALMAFLLGLALGCAQPLTIILTYNHAPTGRSGEALGLRLTVNKLTQIAVPLAFGALGSAFGLIPVFWANGALLLTGYLGGAVATHVRVHNPLFSHILFPTYVAAMVWGGLYLRNERLRALVSRR